MIFMYVGSQKTIITPVSSIIIFLINPQPKEKKTGAPHSVVVYPESTADIVKIATKYRMPITPYLGATSLEGHFREVSPPFLEFGFG